MIETIIAGIGVPLLLYETWVRLIAPRRLRAKLRRLYALVEQWYDEIDRTIESGLNTAVLDNLEDKITDYIRDHRLQNHRLEFPDEFRARFLKSCGFRTEFLLDPNLFEKYARAPHEGIDLMSWWTLTRGDFYRFRRNYSAKSSETNFSDVKMRLKLLKMYTGAKVE